MESTDDWASPVEGGEGEGERVDEGVDEAGEQGEGRIDGALRWPGRLTPH